MATATKRSKGTKGSRRRVKPGEVAKREALSPEFIEEHVDRHTDLSGFTPKQIEDHALMAARLRKLTGDEICMSFNPTTSVGGDRSSEGHLYCGFIDPEGNGSGEDYITVDDRKGDLAHQLYDELVRISAYYLEIASRIQKARSRKGQFQIAVFDTTGEKEPEIWNSEYSDRWMAEIAIRGWASDDNKGIEHLIPAVVTTGKPMPTVAQACREYHRLTGKGGAA